MGQFVHSPSNETTQTSLPANSASPGRYAHVAGRVPHHRLVLLELRHELPVRSAAGTSADGMGSTVTGGPFTRGTRFPNLARAYSMDGPGWPFHHHHEAEGPLPGLPEARGVECPTPGLDPESSERCEREGDSPVRSEHLCFCHDVPPNDDEHPEVQQD